MIAVATRVAPMVTRKTKRTAKSARTARSGRAAKKTRKTKVVKKVKSVSTGKRARTAAKKPAQRAVSRHGYNPQTGSPTGGAVGDVERLQQLTAEFMAQGLSAHDARERARAIMGSNLHRD